MKFYNPHFCTPLTHILACVIFFFKTESKQKKKCLLDEKRSKEIGYFPFFEIHMLRPYILQQNTVTIVVNIIYDISLVSDSKNFSSYYPSPEVKKIIMSLGILMAKLRYLLFFVDLYLINYLVCILSSVAKQEGQHCV